MQIKLFGNSVLVRKVTPKNTSTLYVPESQSDIHKIGEVVVVGNGKVPNGTIEPSLVKVGDIVYFQTNAVMAANTCYEHEKESFINLHQGDLIAKINTPKDEAVVTYDAFEMLGRWSLLRVHQRQVSSILIPENINNNEFIYFTLAKRGADVDLEIEIGQELLINHGRINPILLENKNYAYIDKGYILGVNNAPTADVIALAQ